MLSPNEALKAEGSERAVMLARHAHWIAIVDATLALGHTGDGWAPVEVLFEEGEEPSTRALRDVAALYREAGWAVEERWGHRHDSDRRGWVLTPPM